MQRLISLLSLFVILLLLQGCFHDGEPKTYMLYRSTVWQDVDLYGTENNLHGFVDDTFFEIARLEGFKVQFTTVSTKSLLPFLDQKGVDGVLTTFTPTPKSEKEYLFSDPFFSFGPVLLLRADDTLEHFKDLKVKVIGFARGTGEDLTTREDLGYIFRPYGQIISAIEELIAGRIDAVLVDSIYGHQLVSGLYANKIKIATPLFKIVKFRLAVKKEKSNELITKFNEGLERLKKEGTYEKILTYWGLYEPEIGGS